MAFGPEAGLRLVDEIGEGRLSVSGRPTGRGAFRIPGCGHADPQRAGKGLSSRTGRRLRRPALNPICEAPLGSGADYAQGRALL